MSIQPDHRGPQAETTNVLSGLILIMLGLFWVATVLSCGGFTSLMFLAAGGEYVAVGIAGLATTVLTAFTPPVLVWVKVAS